MADDRLKDRLDAFRHHIAAVPPSKTVNRHPARYKKLAEHVGGDLISGGAGAFCRIASNWTAEHRLGSGSLGDSLSLEHLPFSAFSMHEVEGAVPVEQLLFVDTETTGLGGTGTVAFLVGCGSITENGFEVRQYLIPDYSDETAMLETLLEEFGDERVLVTYNGAAFDLPVLTDRMVINRVAREIPHAAHIDLLHPTRRLFKRRLKDCSLTNVERELFEFRRVDDIPGYLVPSAYFAWLADESLDDIKRVLEHNRLDIVTLCFLATHVVRVFQSEGGTLDEIEDLYSLSRIYDRRRRTEQVLGICERLADSESAEIRLFQAHAFKRAGQFERAVSLWQSLSESDGREAYWACLELAKYFEHQGGEPSTAIRFARQAVRICPYGDSHQAMLEHRLIRLQTKIRS